MLVNLRDRFPIEWDKREVVWKDTGTAYTVERVVTQHDYEQEGYFLAHCLGTKDAEAFNRDHRVYSIRDPFGIPHATILAALAPYQRSPYSHCNDLFGTKLLCEGAMFLKVLQVRGRMDELARAEYHQIARRFYRWGGGETTISDAVADHLCFKHGDTDVRYHALYYLDERQNHYTWKYTDTAAVEAARKAGTSL